MALQAPRQPLPHQDGEDPAGPRLANDPGPGESTLWYSSLAGQAIKKEKSEVFLNIHVAMSVISEEKSKY